MGLYPVPWVLQDWVQGLAICTARSLACASGIWGQRSDRKERSAVRDNTFGSSNVRRFERTPTDDD